MTEEKENSENLVEVYPILLEHIEVSDEREEDPQAFDDLVRSITEMGLLQPIVVAPVDEGGSRYKVLCGRRRLRAMKSIGCDFIPAVVTSVDEIHREMVTITENLHRLELAGAERDEAILRYAQLYDTLHPGTGERAKVRQTVMMGWTPTPDVQDVLADPQGVAAVVEDPMEPTPVVAAAKAFGVAKETVKKAITRAKSFTPAQRKVLDDANVTGAELDLLAKETPEIASQVVNLVAANYSFDEAMSEVMKDQGKAYMGSDKTLDEVESRLAKIVARRQISDPEAFDNDSKLFWAVEGEIRRFKKRIDWIYKKEVAGKNPHGLYYKRLSLLLETTPPRLWQPCKCQKNGESQFNCSYCRSGAYQIP